MATAHTHTGAHDDNITLAVSKEEAATLAAIVAHVGGSPVKSPRRHISSISSALATVGFTFTEGAALVIDKQASGSIIFQDDPTPFVPGYYRDNRDGEILVLQEEPNLRNWTRVTVFDEDGHEYTR